MKTAPKKVAQRVEEYEARLLERGGRKLNGIRLSPEAAEVLAAMEKRGETATKAINRLLIAARGQEQ